MARYKINHQIDISLIIITKNRPRDLICCLRSLKKQIVHPSEFIIIDSSSDTKTLELIKRYKKQINYPVKYIYEPRSGFPLARNLGLQTARFRWVSFTDDDCIMRPDWIKQIRTTIAKFPNAAAIAGESQPYYIHNMISQVTNFNEQHWKKRVILNYNILDLETLDNKNVAYNLGYFKRHRITYDESRSAFFGASDDCDLGMQIQKSGGSAIYNPKMIVYHKDLVDIRSYTKRIIIRSLAHATYEVKWQAYRKQIHISVFKQIRFSKFFSNYIQENKLNYYESAILFLLLMYTALVTKLLKLYIRIKFRYVQHF
jgi:glycosyltransferase involved in cell wall biosynthesis